jgi:hypothetical protein
MMNDWQPIETAPRDGSQFQAWSIDGWVPYAAWETQYDSVGGETFCEYTIVDYDGIEGWEANPRLTHWKPHPTAPA